MAPDGLPAGYDFVSDAYTAPSGAGGGEACALPQLGTKGDDTPVTLPPSASGDAIRGAGGDDRLRGRAGDDCLYGQAGDDRLRGDEGADELKGGAGRDRIAGGAGKDALGGGAGADVISAKDGERDKIECGPGQRHRRRRRQGQAREELLKVETRVLSAAAPRRPSSVFAIQSAK